MLRLRMIQPWRRTRVSFATKALPIEAFSQASRTPSPKPPLEAVDGRLGALPTHRAGCADSRRRARIPLGAQTGAAGAVCWEVPTPAIHRPTFLVGWGGGGETSKSSPAAQVTIASPPLKCVLLSCQRPPDRVETSPKQTDGAQHGALATPTKKSQVETRPPAKPSGELGRNIGHGRCHRKDTAMVD